MSESPANGPAVLRQNRALKRSCSADSSHADTFFNEGDPARMQILLTAPNRECVAPKKEIRKRSRIVRNKTSKRTDIGTDNVGTFPRTKNVSDLQTAVESNLARSPEPQDDTAIERPTDAELRTLYLKFPAAVLKLAAEIEMWEKKQEAATMTKLIKEIDLCLRDISPAMAYAKEDFSSWIHALDDRQKVRCKGRLLSYA